MVKEYRAVLWDYPEYPEDSPGGGGPDSTLTYDQLPKTSWFKTEEEALKDAKRLNTAEGTMHSDLYTRIEKRDLELTEMFKELIGRFSFLEHILNNSDYPVTGVRVEENKTAPAGSAIEPHSDSGYEYWTKVHYFDGITVHEYVTDAPPKGDPDCEIVIYTKNLNSIIN